MERSIRKMIDFFMLILFIIIRKDAIFYVLYTKYQDKLLS